MGGVAERSRSTSPRVNSVERRQLVLIGLGLSLFLIPLLIGGIVWLT